MKMTIDVDRTPADIGVAGPVAILTHLYPSPQVVRYLHERKGLVQRPKLQLLTSVVAS